LARPPEEISLADILAAVDGPLTALMGEHDHCEGHCVLQEVWVGVSDEMRKFLDGYTLADLVERTQIGHPATAG
jgi:Rrf2 family iron-sulfur cluster assembly transcriptional regulator